MTQPTDPRWPAGPPPQQPPVLRDTAGRPLHDPRAPLGAPAPATSTISSYAPPRSRSPWVVGIAGIVIALVIGLATTVGPRLWGTQTPSASPTPSQAGTGAVSGTAFATEDGRLRGSWEALQTRWDENGLDVQLRITVTTGTLDLALMAYSNQDLQMAQGTVSMLDPRLDTATVIETGEQRTGWVHFSLDRGTATVILQSLDFYQPNTRQLSALVVAG